MKVKSEIDAIGKTLIEPKLGSEISTEYPGSAVINQEPNVDGGSIVYPNGAQGPINMPVIAGDTTAPPTPNHALGLNATNDLMVHNAGGAWVPASIPNNTMKYWSTTINLTVASNNAAGVPVSGGSGTISWVASGNELQVLEHGTYLIYLHAQLGGSTTVNVSRLDTYLYYRAFTGASAQLLMHTICSTGSTTTGSSATSQNSAVVSLRANGSIYAVVSNGYSGGSRLVIGQFGVVRIL